MKWSTTFWILVAFGVIVELITNGDNIIEPLLCGVIASLQEIREELIK